MIFCEKYGHFVSAVIQGGLYYFAFSFIYENFLLDTTLRNVFDNHLRSKSLIIFISAIATLFLVKFLETKHAQQFMK